MTNSTFREQTIQGDMPGLFQQMQMQALATQWGD